MVNTPKQWSWIWPEVGPNPIHHGLDSEMFDSTDFPYTETFVREAIQNSLDARHDRDRPVIVSFHFHSDGIGPRRAFLEPVIEHRKTAGLEIPDEWSKGNVRWLIVEDFNSRGLSDPLESRTSDFWGYWLNFGLSNKTGTGRGGRGIGRVTFLIASRLQSVIGHTRRQEDALTATCGMAVLLAKEDGDVLRSTHAYLAEGVQGNIYRLHQSPEFQSQVRKAFAFKGYDDEYQSGLGLAILYPHDDLKADGILAAAIENFAPAIINNDLVLSVDGRTLDASSIEEVATDPDVVSRLHDDTIRNSVSRYLTLVRQAASEKTSHRIELQNPTTKALREQRDTKNIESLRKKIEIGPVILDIAFPLTRDGSITSVHLRAVVCTSPSGQKPIDRFFREGMSLPRVKDKSPGELDLVTLVSEGPLATYLNFCEGKAHLDLLESKDVIQKLKDKGFNDGPNIKRLIKNLPMELRQLLLPDVTAPNSQIFEKYFAKPKKVGPKGEKPPGPPGPIIQNTPEFEIKQVNPDGLHIKANLKFTEWPVNATITLAYADGSSRPSWSPYDFILKNLDRTQVGCDISIFENTMHATNCSENTDICITGFDRNREVDASIKVESSDNA